MLSDIFRDLAAHRTSSDRPVICEMGPNSEIGLFGEHVRLTQTKNSKQ